MRAGSLPSGGDRSGLPRSVPTSAKTRTGGLVRPGGAAGRRPAGGISVGPGTVPAQGVPVLVGPAVAGCRFGVPAPDRPLAVVCRAGPSRWRSGPPPGAARCVQRPFRAAALAEGRRWCRRGPAPPVEQRAGAAAFPDRLPRALRRRPVPGPGCGRGRAVLLGPGAPVMPCGGPPPSPRRDGGAGGKVGSGAMCLPSPGRPPNRRMSPDPRRRRRAGGSDRPRLPRLRWPPRLRALPVRVANAAGVPAALFASVAASMTRSSSSSSFPPLPPRTGCRTAAASRRGRRRSAPGFRRAQRFGFLGPGLGPEAFGAAEHPALHLRRRPPLAPGRGGRKGAGGHPAPANPTPAGVEGAERPGSCFTAVNPGQ